MCSPRARQVKNEPAMGKGSNAEEGNLEIVLDGFHKVLNLELPYGAVGHGHVGALPHALPCHVRQPRARHASTCRHQHLEPLKQARAWGGDGEDEARRPARGRCAGRQRGFGYASCTVARQARLQQRSSTCHTGVSSSPSPLPPAFPTGLPGPPTGVRPGPMGVRSKGVRGTLPPWCKSLLAPHGLGLTARTGPCASNLLSLLISLPPRETIGLGPRPSQASTPPPLAHHAISRPASLCTSTQIKRRPR